MDTPNPTGRGGFSDNPQNINRNGRPKGNTIRDLIILGLGEIDNNSGRRYLDLLVEKILDVAIREGNFQMIKTVWNYVDGMPLQRSEINQKENIFKTPEDEAQFWNTFSKTQEAYYKIKFMKEGLIKAEDSK